MKPYTCLAVVICSILLMAGCGPDRKKNVVIPELEVAESLMFARPDSALHILQSMSMPSPGKDRENHALWCLLTTQARYKMVMKIPSDSLVSIAYAYYKPTDNARRKAMSALYMGGVNYDLGKVEEAIQFYLEAKTEMEKTDDYQLGYLVMSGLGDIYLWRDLIDYALEACTQAYDYAVKANHKRYQMFALNDLGRCYCTSKEYEKSICAYQKCSKLAVELGLERKYYSIQTELALIYYECGQFGKSLTLIKSFPFSPQTSLLIGKNYLALNQLDSAYYHLQKGLETKSVYTRKTIYDMLYKLSNTPKFQHHMKEYCDSLLFYNDSIMVLDKGKEIIAYKEKYDNEKLLSDKQKLELEKANVTYWWMFTLIIVLALIFMLVYIYLRKKIAIHKKEEELTNLALQLHEKELEVDKNESYIAELQAQYAEDSKKEELLVEQKEMLDSLKKENERLCLEKERLQNKMALYSVSSNEATHVKILSDKLCRLEKREQELCMQLLSCIPLLRQLHLKPIYLNDAELKEVRQIADNVFQNFTQRLSKDVSSLSEYEIILCCLIKLRFSITEISIFLNIAPASVSRSKLRVKHKIYVELGEDSKKKSFDVWAWEY